VLTTYDLDPSSIHQAGASYSVVHFWIQSVSFSYTCTHASARELVAYSSRRAAMAAVDRQFSIPENKSFIPRGATRGAFEGKTRFSIYRKSVFFSYFYYFFFFFFFRSTRHATPWYKRTRRVWSCFLKTTKLHLHMIYTRVLYATCTQLCVRRVGQRLRAKPLFRSVNGFVIVTVVTNKMCTRN
jgi:hypothetical protein